MAQRHLYLVRHAQQAAAADPPRDGGEGLSPLGVEQAERTAQRLCAHPIDVIHYSTLQRSVETAEVVAAQFLGIPLRPSLLLQECIPFLPPDFVAWYQHHRQSVEAGRRTNIPGRYAAWADLWPRGLSWPEMEHGMDRADLAFNKYFRAARGKDRHEVIVTHGNLLRYFVVRTLGVPAEAWTHTDVNNCGISEALIESDGSMMLVSHNDTGHLPERMRTYV